MGFEQGGLDRLRGGGRGQMRVRADRRRVLPDGCGPGGWWLDADGRRGLDPVPRPRAGRRLGGAGSAPCDGYAWNATTGQDTPAASQIAGFVTAVFGPAGGAVKYSTSRTDIADRRGGPPQVTAETSAAALTVDATMATGGAHRLELGAVSGNGAVRPSPRRRSRRVAGACSPRPAGSTARPRSRMRPAAPVGVRPLARCPPPE